MRRGADGDEEKVGRKKGECWCNDEGERHLENIWWEKGERYAERRGKTCWERDGEREVGRDVDRGMVGEMGNIQKG